MRAHPAQRFRRTGTRGAGPPQRRNGILIGPGPGHGTQCPELSNQYNWPDTLYHPLWAMIPFFCK